MHRTLNIREQFADYTVLEHLRGNMVVNPYLVQDDSGKKFCLRVFRGFNVFNKDPSDCVVEDSEEVYQARRGKLVCEEEGNNFQLFENRLAITRELSRVSGFPRMVATGTYNGSLYFVNEWMDGKDLNKTIRTELTAEEKLKLLHKAVSLCEQMHGLNLLHNDVKPSNYFVTTERGLILFDFDLSLRGERKVVEGRSVLRHELDKPGYGTPSYMAPEITQRGLGIGLTEYSDLWSLGVTGYKLLTGQVPFRARSIDDLGRNIRLNPAKRVESFLPEDFSQQKRVSDLVHWCLEKKWHKRPRAAQFRQELEIILVTEGIYWGDPVVLNQ